MATSVRREYFRCNNAKVRASAQIGYALDASSRQAMDELDMSVRSPSKTPRTGRRKGRIVRPPEAPDQFRLFCYVFFNFVQRVDRIRRKEYFDDIELAIISETIALSAIEPKMRDQGFREQFRSTRNVVGIEPQRGVNALSISAATGIPRETTRRKIKKLIALGAVVEVRRGEYVMKPGFLQLKSSQVALGQIVTDTVRFINDSLDQGLFVWERE